MVDSNDREQENLRESNEEEERKKREAGASDPEGVTPQSESASAKPEAAAKEKTVDNKKDNDKKSTKAKENTFEGGDVGTAALNSSIKNAQTMYDESMFGQKFVAKAATTVVVEAIKSPFTVPYMVGKGLFNAPGALASGVSKVAGAVSGMTGMGNHPKDDAKIENSQEMGNLSNKQEAAGSGPNSDPDHDEEQGQEQRRGFDT